MSSRKQGSVAAANQIIRETTPLAGNICKKRRCGGMVVRKPTPVKGGRQSYQTDPECLLCDEVYMYAENTIKVTKHEMVTRTLKKTHKV